MIPALLLQYVVDPLHRWLHWVQFDEAIRQRIRASDMRTDAGAPPQARWELFPHGL